jgi:hypothetical protein
MIPIFVAFRLGRVWFVCTPVAGDRARVRHGFTFGEAARAAGVMS